MVMVGGNFTCATAADVMTAVPVKAIDASLMIGLIMVPPVSFLCEFFAFIFAMMSLGNDDGNPAMH
jgi:hypothetical protein